MIKIEECDRIAAASIVALSELRDIILAGRCDEGHQVQAFAKHRISAMEKAAEIAEARHEHWNVNDPCDVVCDVTACRDIAKAIREMINGE